MKTILTTKTYDFGSFRLFSLVFRTALIEQSSLNVEELIRERKVINTSYIFPHQSELSYQSWYTVMRASHKLENFIIYLETSTIIYRILQNKLN